MKFPAVFAACAAFALPAFAQKMQTPTGEAPGPWILGTIGVGKGPDAKTPKTTALKGLAIKVGEKGEAAVAYDLDLCRMVGAWTGKFTTPMNLMSRGEYPTAMGEVAFTTGEVPGFQSSAGFPVRSEPAGGLGSPPHFQDPRPEPFGPLPPGQARFKGFYVNGDKTILKWDIGGTEVLEMPGYVEQHPHYAWVRRFFIEPSKHTAFIPIAELPADVSVENSSDKQGPVEWKAKYRPTADDLSRLPKGMDFSDQDRSFFAVRECDDGFLPWRVMDSHLCVEVPASDSPRHFSFRLITATGFSNSVFTEPLFELFAKEKLPPLTKGGPARWPESVVTQGEVYQSPITDHQLPSSAPAYVVDTIKLPDPNPWGAPMFTSGFDFFDDGRAAVCTFHGDVFVVSGIDAKLKQVTWRRFASGLYHPLGLKIVKGEIFVACRDGLWRLNDLNKDGECDFYELFNGDLKVTKNFHEFVFDLHTDAAGNFYFAKAGPVKNGGRGFDQIMAHHGTLMRVSPDGAKLDVVATGFRAPNGIGVGPRGELTSGDNEGTWTPACKINWITPGSFHGVVDLAHGFRGINPSTINSQPSTLSYDRPLCWLPKRVDNSGGSQVWAPEGERWGPWGGKMLHLSYGQSSLYGVLMEEVKARMAGAPPPPPAAGGGAFEQAVREGFINYDQALMQGGVVKFPLQFQSGIMRARFNPKDGQLYVMGLRGWQTNGLKNGCFQRVRSTGAVPRMPIEMHAKKDGIELRFACSLDTQSAADPENWHLEQWRYLWSDAYGSAEYSTEGDIATAAKGHDPVPVKSVAIGTDDRTVFLEIPGLKPVMQMSIRYDLKSADGADLKGEVVNTIHALGAE